MKLTIKGTPKEIAALVVALRERPENEHLAVIAEAAKLWNEQEQGRIRFAEQMLDWGKANSRPVETAD